jgi:hypothetical protein
MRLATLILSAALMTPALLTTGCTEEAQARFDADVKKRKRGVQRKLLKDRSQEFWDAVRWQNWAEAALFLEEGENQLLYLREQTRDDIKFPTMDDVIIEYVFVDGETFAKAEVRASWTEFKPPRRMAEEKQVSQSWYKHHGLWWVAPEEVLPKLDIQKALSADGPGGAEPAAAPPTANSTPVPAKE